MNSITWRAFEGFAGIIAALSMMFMAFILFLMYWNAKIIIVHEAIEPYYFRAWPFAMVLVALISALVIIYVQSKKCTHNISYQSIKEGKQ